MRNLASSARAFKLGRVLVLGDIMLDEYIWGETDRVSPEAPVPVVSLSRRSHALGGAGNAARGVAALGGTVVLTGVVGYDAEAEIVRSILRGSNIIDAVLCIQERPTTTKTRVIANHQQVVRIDREDNTSVPIDIESRLLDLATEAISGIDCVLISDYAKGVVSAKVAQGVLNAALAAGCPVVVDPKGTDFTKYRNATIVKPNRREAFHALGIDERAAPISDDIGRGLVDIVGCAVLVTLGNDGMRLFQLDGTVTPVKSNALTAYDVTGAGDTVAAVLSLALATHTPLIEAATLAALAAGVVVGKIGTGDVTLEELLRTIELSHNAAFRPASPGADMRGANTSSDGATNALPSS